MVNDLIIDQSIDYDFEEMFEYAIHVIPFYSKAVDPFLDKLFNYTVSCVEKHSMSTLKLQEDANKAAHELIIKHINEPYKCSIIFYLQAKVFEYLSKKYLNLNSYQ